MTRVLVVGDVLTDVLAVHSAPLAIDSDIVARISITGGGSVANTAAWLAHLGRSVDLVAVAGEDVAGTDRLAELAAAGVSCAAVRRTAEAPTGSVVVLAQAQHRTMLSDRGANLLLRPSDVESALATLPDVVHLHLSGYVLLDESSRPAGRHALAAARDRGLTTSVDAAAAARLEQAGPAAFRDWVSGVDVLFANLDEACTLTSPELDAASAARELTTTAAHAVVKRGPDGAVWVTRDGSLSAEPGVPVEVVDSTGAGDAFAAAALHAWLDGAGVPAALAAAVLAGAQAVTHLGGRPPPQ
jgi:sugar/nucleoside kinase (ribokinase family)